MFKAYSNGETILCKFIVMDGRKVPDRLNSNYSHTFLDAKNIQRAFRFKHKIKKCMLKY